MSDPAAIARRLSPAQRRLLKSSTQPHGMIYVYDLLPGIALFRRGLLKTFPNSDNRLVFLTPLGLLVRAELERMEARDE